MDESGGGEVSGSYLGACGSSWKDGNEKEEVGRGAVRSKDLDCGDCTNRCELACI